MAEPIIFIKPVGDSLKQGPAVSMNFILEMKVYIPFYEEKMFVFLFLQNLVLSISF